MWIVMGISIVLLAWHAMQWHAMACHDAMAWHAMPCHAMSAVPAVQFLKRFGRASVVRRAGLTCRFGSSCHKRAILQLENKLSGCQIDAPIGGSARFARLAAPPDGADFSKDWGLDRLHCRSDWPIAPLLGPIECRTASQ